MARLFNEKIRCYEDGRVERFSYKKWTEVNNTDNNSGYNSIRNNRKMLLRHRLIASCFLGLNIDDTTQQVDHINHNKLDNRVENLRIVTNQQNQFNREVKGYCWNKRDNMWQSRIMVSGKHISLGYFDTEAEARQSYQEAKLKYHII